MRVKGIFRPTDYPYADEPGGQEAIQNLFDGMFPGVEDPVIDRNHTGMAILAHNPGLARQFGAMSRFMMLDMGWSKRADLRELALQAVNMHFGCRFGAETRMGPAQAAGIGADMIAALPDWQASNLFDDEQKLVIAFTLAAVRGDIPDPLLQDAVSRFGEKGVVEFTALVGFWATWAIVINMASPS